MIRVKVEGRAKSKRRFKDFLRKTDKATFDEMYKEVELISQDSYEECPWKTGILRGTRTVESDRRRKFFAFMIGYGTDYAVPVHENRSAIHDAPTKAKFLEDPVNAAKPKLPRNMKTRLFKKMRGYVGRV